MVMPTIVPVEYAATATDFLKVKCDRSGAARIAGGAVTVPSGTAAAVVIGLVPFTKGARINIHDKSIYCADFGAATTTVDIGIAYQNTGEGTDDLDAFASASTAPQAGGFVTIDENAGLGIVTTGNGWLVAVPRTATTDADGAITFGVLMAYDGLGLDNSNNQS